MADNDRTRGYRDKETYRRPRPQPTSGDPLAELARLIGQQNQSAPSYGPQGIPEPDGPSPHDLSSHGLLSHGLSSYGSEPAADRGWAAPDPYPQQDGYREESAAPHWQDNAASAPGVHGRRYDSHADAAAAHSSRGYSAVSSRPWTDGDRRYEEPHYSDGPYADPQQYSGAQYADPRLGDPRYSGDPRYDDTGYADPRYADPRYADPRYGDQRYGDGASQGYAHPHYPEPNFGTPQGQAAYGRQDGGPAYDNAYGNSYVVPPPGGIAASAAGRHGPAKRRGSMVTVLAVLALAVVGTAAAFGYRAVFTGAGNPVPPPVIKADTQPSKIVPATDSSSKPIQDRIGVKTEKIVPRQEEPVQQAAPGQKRVIAPFLAGQNPQAFPPASANIAPAGSTAGPAATEPKRIKTVPIRPQGTEAPGPRSSRNAAPAEETAAADNHAPMALAPTGSVPPSQRPAGRQAHAAVTPNDTPGGSPFPTPLPASTGPARHAVSGPYAVQVTSQRSEADAQASFRSLQQQFPSVLGNRQPVIRRADLGDRGTYYRAQIPFASQNEASDFCSSLKSAGGQCVVQKN